MLLWIRSETSLTEESRKHLMAPATSAPTSAPAMRFLSKEDLASLMKAGMTHRDSHRFKEARDIFSTIRALCPSEPNAEIGLGSTSFSEGRFDAAISHYRHALKLNPSNAYAHALLGECQIFKGECSAARLSLRRACEIDPKGAYGRLAQELLRLLEFLPARQFPRQDWQI